MVAVHAFPEFIPRKVVSDLGEDCLAEIHLLLSATSASARDGWPGGPNPRKNFQIEKALHKA